MFRLMMILAGMLCSISFTGIAWGVATPTAVLDSTDSNQMSRQVNGTWGYDEKVRIAGSGDFMIGMNDRNDTFEVLRATLYNSRGTVIDLVMDGNSSNHLEGSIRLGSGDYYLSLFAITTSSFNTGAFDIYIDALTHPESVPVPASIWLFSSSLVGLSMFVNKRRNRGNSDPLAAV